MKEILPFLGIFVLPPFVVLFFQALFNRILKGKSAQLVTMISMVAGYPVFFWLVSLVPVPVERDPGFYLFMFLLYSFSAYTYFHLFNMSETSRRVRMIAAISTNQLKDLTKLENIYDDVTMIQVRLDRLVALGQLKVENGRYFSAGRLFLFTAKVLYGLSLALHRPWLPLKRLQVQSRDV